MNQQDIGARITELTKKMDNLNSRSPEWASCAREVDTLNKKLAQGTGNKPRLHFPESAQPKNLSYLIEGELEKAEVVLAAKSITDAIQKMAETAAKWEADDVMPLNDPIRDNFGPEAAAAFSEAVSGKLRDLVKNLGDTKNAISDEIARMQGQAVASGGQDNDLNSMGDDAGTGASGDGSSDLAMDDLPDDASELADDDGAAPTDAPAAPPTDDAADAAPTDAPKFDDAAMGSMKAAGRARKESVAPLGKMLEAALNESLGIVAEADDYRAKLEKKLAFYGVTSNPLTDKQIELLDKKGISVTVAYDLATDMVNGFSFKKALAANTKKIAEEIDMGQTLSVLDRKTGGKEHSFAGQDERAITHSRAFHGEEGPEKESEAVAAWRELRDARLMKKKEKVSENLDRAVAMEYVGMIREGKSTADAAKTLTESYGLSTTDLVEILTSFKK